MAHRRGVPDDRRRRRTVVNPAHPIACGKLRYTSHAAAEAAAKLKAENHADRYPPDLRVYYCGACHGYHHSSQPRKG